MALHDWHSMELTGILARQFGHSPCGPTRSPDSPSGMVLCGDSVTELSEESLSCLPRNCRSEAKTKDAGRTKMMAANPPTKPEKTIKAMSELRTPQPWHPAPSSQLQPGMTTCISMPSAKPMNGKTTDAMPTLTVTEAALMKV
jgi:hypothetical protein